MISGDYKQQELRVMAHLSQDQTLIQHLQEGDPFSVIAGAWHRKEVGEVEKHPSFAVWKSTAPCASIQMLSPRLQSRTEPS